MFDKSFTFGHRRVAVTVWRHHPRWFGKPYTYTPLSRTFTGFHFGKLSVYYWRRWG